MDVRRAGFNPEMKVRLSINVELAQCIIVLDLQAAPCFQRSGNTADLPGRHENIELLLGVIHLGGEGPVQNDPGVRVLEAKAIPREDESVDLLPWATDPRGMALCLDDFCHPDCCPQVGVRDSNGHG